MYIYIYIYIYIYRHIYTFDHIYTYLYVRDADGRVRAKREHLQIFHGFLPESQGQNLALTVLYVPYSLDRGIGGGGG